MIEIISSNHHRITKRGETYLVQIRDEISTPWEDFEKAIVIFKSKSLVSAIQEMLHDFWGERR
jgi:hypothetical protein